MPVLRLFRRRDVVCQQAVELVTDYLEGALPARARKRFEAHLADCPHCTEYLAQMRKTIAAVGRVDVEELRPEVRADLVALYRRYRDEGEPA
jgi:anti-sigma factor RsiW